MPRTKMPHTEQYKDSVYFADKSMKQQFDMAVETAYQESVLAPVLDLEDAFDGGGMLLTGVLIRCMEKTGRELGKETSANEILDNLHKRYRPHKDKGNYNTRLRNMQKAFEEVMEVFDKKDLSLKENKKELVKKCMSLTMECIKAHIFVATEYEEPIQRKEMRMECSQS